MTARRYYLIVFPGVALIAEWLVLRNFAVEEILFGEYHEFLGNGH